MVHLNGHASISIWYLIFYPPALLSAIYCVNKHGLGQNSGWIFLITLSCFRIAGGATQIATYYRPSVGLFVASAILGSFGLSTLILSSLGFLSRAADSSSLSRNGLLNKLVIHAVMLLTAVGLILVIVGDSNVNFSDDNMSITGFPVEIKVGIVIILATWLLLTAITARVVIGISQVIASERLLAWAVVIALPLILVRIIFATLDIFLNDKNFNLLEPTTVVEWLMSVLEECLVVFMYLVVGFIVPQVKRGQQDAAAVHSNLDAGVHPDEHPEMPPRQKIRWRGTPILTLIGIFTDMYSNRKKAHAAHAAQMQETYQKPDQQTSMA